ncbi:uncharacterized protein COLE_05842 [Cutaneotrichosporon oleaginosum]|uniref:uncharacterized protein n=1 Tax=Cutaneotrichosporon oleaginosum TaxID=879819 RepID=UPI0013225D1D|nr:hypothetical protein COLE_05842 [Cutaneotrichosporon oleaginosum]
MLSAFVSTRQSTALWPVSTPSLRKVSARMPAGQSAKALPMSLATRHLRTPIYFVPFFGPLCVLCRSTSPDSTRCFFPLSRTRSSRPPLIWSRSTTTHRHSMRLRHMLCRWRMPRGRPVRGSSRCLTSVSTPRFLEDGLRPTLDKFDTVVGKVVRPIFLQLKVDLEASVSNTAGGAPKTSAGSMTVPAAVSGAPLVREKSNSGVPRLTKESSGSGHPRALAVPGTLQQFASRVDGARKVLETVAAPCGHDGEGWIVKVVVAVVWRGMRVIMEADNSSFRSPSPSTVHKALSGLGKEATPTVVQSPSIAKITSLAILTPRGTSSRPPSPPRTASPFDPATHSLMSFEGLVKRLVTGLVQPPTAPPSSADTDDQEQEHIAREALHEAMEALESAIIATSASHSDNASSRILASVRRLRDDIDDEADEKLDDALEDLPSVQLFNLLQRRANLALGALPNNPPLRLREVTEIWGWTQAEYERQILSGFGPAEEYGPRVAAALKPDIENMLGSLVTVPVDDAASKAAVMTATEWVRALGVALEARCDVKVARA